MSLKTANRLGFLRQPRTRRCLVAGLILLIAVIVLESGFAFRYDFAQGRAALEGRQTERALAYLERAVARDTSRSDAQFLLARCHRHRGEMQLVRKHLGLARSLGHSRKAVAREEWLALAQSGQLRDADPHLPELLQDAGDDGREICEAYVNGYFLTTRFAQAIGLLEVWKKGFPKDAQPFLFQGRYLDIHGSAAAAVDAYREGIQRDSKRPELQLGLARCLVKLHEHVEASAILKKLNFQSPDDPEILDALANCQLEQGEFAQIKVTLANLLRVQPDHHGGQLLLAQVHLQEGQKVEAVQILEALVSTRPFDVNARYAYALALLAIDEKSRASSEFQFVAKGREEVARARSMMDTVSKKEPANAQLRYQIGTLLLQYESPEAGAGWLRSVLEIDPDHIATHAALADYYEGLPNPELAKMHRERAENSSVNPQRM